LKFNRLYPVLSALLFVWLFCYTGVGVLFALVLASLRLRRILATAMQYWAKSVFLFMGKPLHVNGIENINRSNKYILIANHASLFDIVAIMSFSSDIAWFGHERLLRIPIFRQILKMTDYIPFREPNYVNTKQMIDSLINRSGRKTVAIFPEGTRTSDGKIKTFYRGFIYLYRNSDMQILPVTLNGFYELKPKHRSYINFSAKTRVTIHKPLSREELNGKSDQEIIEIVKTIIESAYDNRPACHE
jgi:1-acyl-sn-glycerol-3-phosphate acyltransferase